MVNMANSQSRCDPFFDHVVQYSARIEREADDRTADYILV